MLPTASRFKKWAMATAHHPPAVSCSLQRCLCDHPAMLVRIHGSQEAAVWGKGSWTTMNYRGLDLEQPYGDPMTIAQTSMRCGWQKSW